MKILYFYQYFSTPNGSWGTRVYDFAKDWVALGHQVTVVTSVYSKSDLKPDKFIEIHYYDGIKVIVINIKIDNKQSFLKRILTFLQYSIVATWFAITVKTDIVIASSGPITVGVPGLMAKFLRKKKLVFEVRDLWPQGAIEMGVIKSKLLIKIAYFFEKILYKYSDYIITLSPGMTKDIQDRFKVKQIYSIPNAANIDIFNNNSESSEIPDMYKNNKIAIYTGNIGAVNNTYLILNAAILLKERRREDIIFLIIGEGQQKGEILEKKKQLKLDNLFILDLMPKTELVKYLKNAMVSLVPLKGTPILDTSSPNKLFESLAAGVPVIQNTNGWLKDLLKDNECGFTVNPDDPKDIVDKLIYLADNPQVSMEMGLRGQKLIEQNYDKKILSHKMIERLSAVS